MKIVRRILSLLLPVALLMSFAPSGAAEGYTYTVRLFAGNRGTIGGQSVVVYEGLHIGDRVTFYIEDVTLESNSKYYVRGFRESGRDNDTVDAPSFTVTGDRDYVVAYGVRGRQVAYTVRFLDAAGQPLLPDATYHGNVGDKPVAAFRYIEDCRPRYYNVTKTLSANAAENVLVFTYDKTESTVPSGSTAAPAVTRPPSSGTTATAVGGTTTTAAPPASSAPAEMMDLDADAAASEPFGNPSQAGTVPLWAWIAAGTLFVSLLLLLVLMRRRKRRSGDER